MSRDWKGMSVSGSKHNISCRERSQIAQTDDEHLRVERSKSSVKTMTTTKTTILMNTTTTTNMMSMTNITNISGPKNLASRPACTRFARKRWTISAELNQEMTVISISVVHIHP